MRLLLVDASYFSYHPNLPAPTQSTACFPGINRQADYHNVLVVFVAYELQDTHKSLRKAAIEITKIAQTNINDHIVLIANTHLTRRQASSDYALQLAKCLFALVSTDDTLSVHLEAFGYAGPWTVSAKGHGRSVLGRRF